MGKYDVILTQNIFFENNDFTFGVNDTNVYITLDELLKELGTTD